MSIGCKSYQTISNLLLIALVNTTMRAGVWSSWAVSETTPALGQRRTAGCGWRHQIHKFDLAICCWAWNNKSLTDPNPVRVIWVPTCPAAAGPPLPIHLSLTQAPLLSRWGLRCVLRWSGGSVHHFFHPLSQIRGWWWWRSTESKDRSGHQRCIKWVHSGRARLRSFGLGRTPFRRVGRPGSRIHRILNHVLHPHRSGWWWGRWSIFHIDEETRAACKKIKHKQKTVRKGREVGMSLYERKGRLLQEPNSREEQNPVLAAVISHFFLQVHKFNFFDFQILLVFILEFEIPNIL